MNHINNRIAKVVVGSILIGLTLVTGAPQSGVTPVLALVAIPIMLAGIVDWRPFEWCAKKLVGFMKPVLEHARLSSTGGT